MWAGTAEEWLLVGIFGAGRGGKTWSLLRHPYEAGSRSGRSVRLSGGRPTVLEMGACPSPLRKGSLSPAAASKVEVWGEGQDLVWEASWDWGWEWALVLAPQVPRRGIRTAPSVYARFLGCWLSAL